MTENLTLDRAAENGVRADAGLAALRIFAGLALSLGHGVNKLPPSPQFLAGVEAMGFPLPTVFAWAAAFSESLGGLLLAVGLLTRVSAVFILATMSVAAFIRQAGDPFAERELAMLYAVVMVLFIAAGAGRFSLDAWIRRTAGMASGARVARARGALVIGLLFGCAGAQGEPAPADGDLRIGFVAAGGTDTLPAALGVQLGLEEVQRAAELMGRQVALVVENARTPAEARAAGERLARDGVAAIIGGADEESCVALRDVAERRRVIFLNVGCRADALRDAEASRYTFHVQASDAMYRDAGALDPAPVLWHAGLSRYGAAQLNDRFRARFGNASDGSWWASWMAVKLLWESTLRSGSSRPPELARFLAGPRARFDGHKGRQLGFDPATHQLDQPLYAPARDAVAGEDAAGGTASRAVLPAGGLPRGSGRLLLVSNEGSESVSIIDTQVARVIATIPLDGRPRGIHVTPDGGRAFVALSDDAPQEETDTDAIVAIDLATGRIVARFAAGTDPEQFAIAPDGSRLYAANEDAGTLSITDLGTGRVVATLLVGIEPEGVAVSPDGRWVYVTAETSNTVSVVDTRADRVVSSFLVDVRPRAAAFSPDGARAFVTAEIGGTVMVVDVRTHEVTGTIPLPGSDAKPVGLVVSPDGARVFVANGHAHSISMIDAAAGRVVRTIEVGRRPWGLALSPDGRRLYAANGVSNDISVVDVERGVEVRRIPVGERPWGVAIAP